MLGVGKEGWHLNLRGSTHRGMESTRANANTHNAHSFEVFEYSSTAIDRQGGCRSVTASTEPISANCSGSAATSAKEKLT